MAAQRDLPLVAGGMTELVAKVISEAAGMDVEPSFALEGLRINSIGTVVVVEQLSVALGGMRIRPIEFFQHHTIQQLAQHLHNRVAVEKPELLKQLGLSHTPLKATHTQASSHTATKNVALEAAASLQRVLSGLRGALIIWVVTEHVHRDHVPTRYMTNTVFIAMLQGFSLYLWWAGSHGRVNWNSYFFNKAIGTFPAYWLTLCAYLPRYIYVRRELAQSTKTLPGYLQIFNYRDQGVRPWLEDAVIHVTASQQYFPLVKMRGFGDRMYYASVQWNHYIYFFLAIVGSTFVARRLSPTFKARLHARQGSVWLFLMVLFLIYIPHKLHTAYGISDDRYLYAPQLLGGMCTAALFLQTLEKRRESDAPADQSMARVAMREAVPVVLLLVFLHLAANSSYVMTVRMDEQMYFVVLPCLGTVLLFVLLFNDSWLRSTIFESDILCCIGDLSYMVYILHWVFITYYLRMAIESWEGITPVPGSVPMTDLTDHTPKDGTLWIGRQTLLFKSMALLMSTCVAWVVQYMFIDTFITPAILRIARRAHPDTPSKALKPHRTHAHADTSTQHMGATVAASMRSVWGRVRGVYSGMARIFRRGEARAGIRHRQSLA